MAYLATPQPWVALADVEAAVPDGIPSDLSDTAALYVATFAGEIEALANRPLSVVVVDELAEVLDGIVLTQHRPVVSVEDCTYGSSVPTTGISSGLAVIEGVLPGGSLLAPVSRAAISYTARFPDTVMNGAKGIVVARTRRMLSKEDDDSLGLSSTAEEGHTESYVEEGWLESEKAFIESLRRRVGA